LGRPTLLGPPGDCRNLLGANAMDCRQLLAAMNEHGDGETESALCEAIREHLVECDRCRLVIDNLRQAIALCRAGSLVPLPRGMHQRLCSILRERWLARFPTFSGAK
jgi:hypothetical protein